MMLLEDCKVKLNKENFEKVIRAFAKLRIRLRNNKDLGRKESILKHAGRIGIGGNALEDERKLY
ncbi:hypothetical protein JCM9492_13720 [Aquifex pyrophilus]